MPLGLYEAETASWLSQQVKPGTIFFDVGANAGYFTLLGSRCVGPSGKVFAFEPVPDNVEVLERQLRINDFHNAEVCPLALTNRGGTVEFVLEGNNANSHLSEVEITHGISAPRDSFEVQAATMDQWIRTNSTAPDVVKVDVEGAEMHVLEGARETLASVRPLWLISTHSSSLCDEVRRTLENADYQVEPLAGFSHELIGRPQ
jgi:FkbM family methyltransferase